MPISRTTDEEIIGNIERLRAVPTKNMIEWGRLCNYARWIIQRRNIRVEGSSTWGNMEKALIRAGVIKEGK